MKTITKLLFALLVLLTYSCDDIIEEDITGDNVKTLYPSNNLQIESNVVNFQWEELKGAKDYRLQVYSTTQNIMLDTLVSKTSFLFSLTPGSYQWRVRGENFAYETPYTFPLSFTLIETMDLTNQQVQLLYPDQGTYTKLNTLTFSWTKVPVATQYSYQLLDVTNGNILIHENTSITGTSYALPAGIIIQDGNYTWKVKALNSENATETQYSNRNFYVDKTAPNIPVNNTPLNNNKVKTNDTVTFTWAQASDNGPVTSPITYNIQISKDQDFTAIISSSSVSNLSYQYTFAQTGDYYWRVQAVDKAGNTSSYGGYFKITVE